MSGICKIFHSSFNPWMERLKSWRTQMHTSRSLPPPPLFCPPSQRPKLKHTHAHMQTGLTKPWRDRVRFIAHLGWLDQWQPASCKSLPQTELNKQTGSVYTDPGNLLIHITCFLTNTHMHTHSHTLTHTHAHGRRREYVRRYCVHIQEHEQTPVHESRKYTHFYTQTFACAHTQAHTHTYTHTHTHTVSVTFAHYPLWPPQQDAVDSLVDVDNRPKG